MTTHFTEPRLDRGTEAPPLLLVGVDHHCAPIETREKVAYGGDEGHALLRCLVAAEEIAEACLISTCNRTEVYLLPNRDAAAYRLALAAVFSERAPEIEAEGRFYVKRGAAAARHLLEVASGLQSMVLGEPEILGQVKRAAQLADDTGTGGPLLKRLLRTAIAASGRARHETEIAAGAISFGYAVVDLAVHLFGRLDGCSVLMLGAGETARQVARTLCERGAGELVVTNRSPARAEKLLARLAGGRSVPFEERSAALARADVVVSATSAATPVLTRADLERATGERRGRPLLVADLGVPRNVEVAAGDLEDLVLQDVDSLEQLIGRNLRRRRAEIPRVQLILDRELELFLSWYHGMAAEPLVERLQKRAEAIRRREVESARGHFPEATHPHLDRLTRALVRKLLHHPSTHLRSPGRADPEGLETARRLFQLDED